MIALAEQDILQAVSVPEVMEAVEAALVLYETGEPLMPDRMHLDYAGNTLLLMPCFTPDAFGTKLVTVFPDNARRNIPVLNGVMILNDSRSGVPLAILNGQVLTALRTGAVGSVGLRHLAPENSRRLGIVGAGVQGSYQAYCAAIARNLTDIFVFDLHPEKVDPWIERLSQKIPNVHLHKAARIEDLLENSEMVITATTSSEPVLPDDPRWLDGKHFVGIGSFKPTMREFPSALYRLLELVFVDTEHALKESGDVYLPLEKHWIKKEQVRTLGWLLTRQGDESAIKQGTTLFKSVGMALFDVCVSRLVYENAVRKGLGKEIIL